MLNASQNIYIYFCYKGIFYITCWSLNLLYHEDYTVFILQLRVLSDRHTTDMFRGTQLTNLILDSHISLEDMVITPLYLTRKSGTVIKWIVQIHTKATGRTPVLGFLIPKLRALVKIPVPREPFLALSNLALLVCVLNISFTIIIKTGNINPPWCRL